MIETANGQLTIRALKGKLLAAYEYLVEQKDQENGEKVKQLAGKLVNEEFAIAFCGHFSAGKSTIINRLVGENLLPSSPIPTSANLVKVKAGEEEYAKVFFKNEKPRMYLAPYDYKMVKNYCKDGDQIQSIEISHADSQLPSHTVVMDTPGIDSADDAHRIATESAIHLADLIFYVMDYNHVQSELNFMFTKELTEAGKEVYLVINQVDKHSHQELSFGDFKTSVVEAFASWGVKPADIFYTSLKQDDHEYNQFPELQAFLAERLKEKDSLLLQSIFHSLQKILKDHLDAAKKKTQAELQPFKDTLNELSAKEQEELEANYSKLAEEKNALDDGEKAGRDFEAGIHKIMANAYLMPFQTRALAESYLEACQPEFKVGWLFSKQKTLDARQERLQLFYQDILEKTKSQLEWHLRDFLQRFLKEKRMDNKELLEKIQGYHVEPSEGLLTAAVKEGARLSGDYVINYTENVANEIKRLAKEGLSEWKSDMLKALQERNAAIQERLEQKSENMAKYIAAWEQVKQWEAADRLEQSKVERLLMEATGSEADRFQLFDIKEEDFEIIYGEHKTAEPIQKKVSLPVSQPAPKVKGSLPAGSSDRMKETAGKLKHTAQLVHTLPGFGKLTAELREKAERLEHKGFTVALFGAFSAGKSSFANALIGERVLPVSPNPMTAAISKIKPVNETYSHGTVRVKVKEERAMLEDVNHALKVFEVQADSLADALEKVQRLNEDLAQTGAGEKTNYAFLQAFTRGFASFSQQLGNILETAIGEFGDYVALEEKSCFVEWIDLYYDCPLTRKGITLVDTPGADSINARHTGVAFDFIKNSDAILFVTYYNHAFSKADREFLMQLGRVKDSFQLDKMFFMINAIDLANNEEEKETVIEYVQEQLVKYGVRNPHLYPLSSLKALQEKEEQTALPASGMAAFEEAFYHFITHDLANLAVAASEKELGRVKRLVAKLIESAREDAAVKEQKRANIEAEKAAIHAVLGEQTAHHLKERLNQETEELVYYIKQRVFLRFNDFFRESFNPAVLRDDGRNLKKVLQHALEELLEQVGFELAQEMRATTVRLDRFAEKVAAEYQMSLIERLGEMNQDLSFSLFELENKAQMEFEAAFKEINYGLFSKAMSYFKNPKAFFEKNESKLMGEELHRVLSTAADEYLQKEKTRVQVQYGYAMENGFGELIAHMAEQADDFYLSLLSALDGGVPAEQLVEIQQNLAEIIE